MKTHGLVGFDSPLEALKKFSYTHYVDTVYIHMKFIFD